jgi:hypothetical protein
MDMDRLDALDVDVDGDVDLRDFAEYSNWLSEQAEEVVYA